MELPSESVPLALWLERESGPGSLSPADRKRSGGQPRGPTWTRVDPLTWMSRHCSTDTQKVAVFPVPDWDLRRSDREGQEDGGRPGDAWRRSGMPALLGSYWAITSRPLMICLMALC